jgi:hypothetical protein
LDRGRFAIAISPALRGSKEWIEFDATCRAWPLLDGNGNVDSYSAVRDGRVVHGATLRLFNPSTNEWSLYWADTIRPGEVYPPMVGKFDGKTGTFFGEEEVDGRKVLCRFLWTRGGAPKWEQAFSADAGQTWRRTGSWSSAGPTGSADCCAFGTRSSVASQASGGAARLVFRRPRRVPE